VTADVTFNSTSSSQGSISEYVNKHMTCTTQIQHDLSRYRHESISNSAKSSRLPSLLVFCSVSQCLAVQYVTVCCSALRCVAVCCSVLQCVAVCCSVLQCVAVCCSVLQRVAVYCSVLQCVAVCCSPLISVWGGYDE